ncbi:MAG TPA: NAD(P)H-dependent oxidoreductase [Longimicrobium sp.]|nr:NAD(P)H-dependent oxidoreductase [Longimicrobium sp.]
MSNEERCPVRVLVFGASLREGSLNQRLAELAARVVEAKGAAADRARMADFDCPGYDNDAETGSGIPLGAERLRQRLVAADALIIASPEYNASMPGYLKNAIDWASRFRPQPFNGRQALLLSASPSMVGGNRGLWSLRIPLEHLGARVYPDMFSLAQAHQAFDADGNIADAQLRQRFEGTIDCFLELVEAAKHYPAIKKQWVEFLGERPDPATDRVETSPAQAA